MSCFKGLERLIEIINHKLFLQEILHPMLKQYVILARMNNMLDWKLSI